VSVEPVTSTVFGETYWNPFTQTVSPTSIGFACVASRRPLVTASPAEPSQAPCVGPSLFVPPSCGRPTSHRPHPAA
jgi:hypothetical protein